MSARSDFLQALTATIQRADPGKPFILASGKESSYYIDVRKAVLTSSKTMDTAASSLYEILPEEVVSIGGVPTAGLMLMGALLVHCHQTDSKPFRKGFYTREKPKVHGMGLQVEGSPSGVACLVEDTVTTGMSLIQHTQIARDHGLDVRYALSVYDRQEGGREALAEIGVMLLTCFTARDLGL